MPARSRRARVIGVTALLASAVVVGSDVSAAPTATFSVRPFTRTVEPWVPGSPPSTRPMVRITAACVRLVADGQLEAVFGYHNLAKFSVYVGLESDTNVADHNVIVRETWSLRSPHRTVEIEDTGPQATMLLPGRHPYVFAVRFDLNERVAWQLRVPSFDDPVIDSGWRVTVRPRLLAPCGRTVPDHFAVVQTAGVAETTTDIVHDDDGHIASYDMEIRTSGVSTVCGAGGSVLPFTAVVGWNANQANVAPLPPGDIIETIGTPGGGFFEMTRVRERAVLDVTQKVQWFGPIADVTGRCRFGGEIVKSDVFWAGIPTLGTITPVLEDGAVVELLPDLVLPGGVRIR